MRAFAQRRRPDLVGLGVAAVGSLVAAIAVLRVWRGDLDDAWAYRHDALFFAMLVKGVVEFGWHLNNPHLAAPLGQELHDVPAIPLETASVALLKLIGLFTSDPAAVLNVYFLLGFPLTAVSAYLVLRALRLSPAVSAVCSILFALLPYHFIRGEQHLFLGAYFTVPVACYLVVQVLRGELLFERRRGPAGRGLLAFASRRSLATVALCFLVGSSGGYYIAFTLAALAAATLVAFVAHGSRRAFVTGAVVTAAVAGTLAVAFSPSLLYAAQHGRNPETAREPTITDELGLRIVHLLLPVRDHRLEPLSDLREHVEGSDETEGASASLGLLGSAGFLALLLTVGARAARRGRGPDDDDRLGAAAAATVVVFVVGTAGGLAALARFWVAPELRAWNRVSVFLAFFAFLALGLLLERLRGHRALAGRPLAWASVLALVLCVGVLDQTNKSFVPEYAEVAAAEASDREFVERVERALPPGANVFQLPYVPFFEAQALASLDNYALLRPYLHSRRLHWSFGAVKGRPRDWFAALEMLPTNYVLPAVTAAGFQGLVVHRDVYGDAGAEVESQICGLLDQAPLRSSNDRLAFFDLGAYDATLRSRYGAERVANLGVVTVDPVVLRYDDGFHPAEQTDEGRWAWTKGKRARVNLFNPADGPRGVRFAAGLSAGDPAAVLVTYPDGRRQRVDMRGGAAVSHFYHDLTLRPGDNFVSVQTVGGRTEAAPGDERKLYFRLNDPVVVDTGLLRFVVPIPPRRPACNAA